MKTVFRFFGLAAIITAAALCVSCARHAVRPSAEYSAWIKAYTGNIISRNSTVKIVLAAPVDNSVFPSGDQTRLDRLFSFSPDMKGTVRMTSPDMVEFIPDDGQMKPGTLYKASFRLGDVTGIQQKDLETFRFSFMTEVRKAEMTTEGIVIREDSPEKAEVHGRLVFSEPVDKATAEAMLSCRMHGQSPVIRMADGGPGMSRDFTVEGIRAGEKTGTLKLVLDGSSSGFSSRQETEVDIPAAGEFKVISTSISSGESPHVDIFFSSPLDSDMDPDGLFVLKNAGRTFIRIKDNYASVFYESAGEDMSLEISPAVRSAGGERLGNTFARTFRDNEIKPAVELLLKGNILPDADSLILPFRAVSLYAVDISVIKIFEDNILAFLQDNGLDGDSGLRRSGRLVAKKTVRLDSTPGKDLRQWQDFAVDISGLFRQEAGALYRIRLSFRQEYSLYGKSSVSGAGGGSEGLVVLGRDGVTDEDMAVWDTPSPYYYESFYDWDKYDWKERDNPLDPTYYMMSDRFPACNLMASDVGIIVKSAGGSRLWVTVNDIMTAMPVKNAAVTVYNYQLQTIGKAVTDNDGFAEIATEGKAFAVTASHDGSTSYMKVTDGTEKPVSRFDTGGVKTGNGLKAFIYGERGVWRPGDTLHVAMIIEDLENTLPDTHPVTMELYTPQGQFHSRLTDTRGMEGFHVFHIPTAAEDPTGTWNAYFKVGGSTFHKALMIESIKPNRLKINVRTSDGILQSGKGTWFTMSSSWLTGPAAAGLEGRIEMSLTPAGKTFDGYDGYTFSDPASSFAGVETLIFDKVLGNNGKAAQKIVMPSLDGAPGMMQARLTSRVAEAGGDESITSTTMLFSPYDAYAGIKLPDKDSYIETDTEHRFPVAVVDKDGKPVAGHRIEYRIYRLDWSWWWESRAEELDSYVNGTAAKPYSKGSFISGSSPSEIPFRLDYPDWGRFFVYVKDVTGGHATGGVIMVDWPAYRGRSDKKDPDALTMLTFSTDKKEYKCGETATVFIPAADGGMALVSLENGSRVISRHWVKTSAKGDTPFRFAVTEDMAPNFYIHISLLQRHSNTANDMPVRMYGVQPVYVNDESSRLHPVISMPETVRPQEEFEIRVSESNGRKMTYTIAIVDEGLLDLTAFKTPDPWTSMYAKEALGVRTWDLYDDVVGAFGGRLSPLTAIGGDQTINREARQDNRFNAVVKYLGPFSLDKKENVHKVTLPMYVGSVRVMLVAGHDGAFGNAEKTVPVKTPLMVLSSLPRVLGQGEEIVLPVNVFAMEDGIGDISVQAVADGPAAIEGNGTASIRMTESGDTLVRFRLAATSGTGPARITVSAAGGGYTASETVSVPVRNPSPYITTLSRATINPGESHLFEWEPFMSGEEEGSAVIEMAGFPSIDFNSCMDFFSDYRHSCSEQISAKGMALLSIKSLLAPDNAAEAGAEIPGLLEELYSRQLSDGGFAYWPGQAAADEWATSMAGHFMSLASDMGYEVNSGVFSAWKNFQRRCARNWRHSGINDFHDLVQAYRLYTLALASSPLSGVMNSMKETGGLSVQAQWRLAAAYALTGKKDIARSMIQTLRTDVKDYPVSNVTYGSPLRDKAMMLETLVLADDMDGAVRLAGDVAEQFSARLYTTQVTAFTAVAMGRLADRLNTGAVKAVIISGGKERTVEKAAAIATEELASGDGSAEIRNLSKGPLHVTLATRTRPDFSTPTAASQSGIALAVSWTDLNGNPVSPDRLRQGTDFMAAITVSDISGTEDHTGLALTFPVPSGWEIFNRRMFSGEDMASGQESASYSYADIRDDRAVIYLDLAKGTRKTFSIRLRAAYEGRFILPATTCEMMYDPSVNARTASGTVEVTR